MSNRNASRLDPGLIARKGEAAPASLAPTATTAQAETAIPSGDSLREVPRTGPHGDTVRVAARGLHGTIAVTVRLDPARYERLKVHGARLRRTNQEIFVQALDGYFREVAE